MSPAPPSDQERLLKALQAEYPNPVWSPNAKLRLTAHSRAAELRKAGWDVQSVSRRHPGSAKREFGYVLRLTGAERPATTKPRRLSYIADVLVPAATAAKRCGLTLEQLRYLDRIGSVSFDVVTNGHGRYLSSTLPLLEAAGKLVALGIGLDTALDILRSHAHDVAAALRLAAPVEVVA